MKDITLKYEILGLLLYKDLHGYRIRTHIDNNFRYMWAINPGRIYPTLKKMRDEGIIELVDATGNGKKRTTRKLYTITAKGREEFYRWLDDCPQKGMIIKSPFLTRFVFYHFGDKKRVPELIDEQIALYREEYETRLKLKEKWDRWQNIYVKLTAELGRDLNMMYLDWLQRAKEEISSMDK